MIPVNVTLFGMRPLLKSVKDAISRSPKSDTFFMTASSNCLLVSRGTLHLLELNEERLGELLTSLLGTLLLGQAAIDAGKGSQYFRAD